MACGCGCNSCEDKGGLLAGLSGNLMSGVVAAGSTIAVGFELSLNTSFSTYNAESVSNILEGCLYNTGGFSDVKIRFDQPLGHHYLTVTAIPSEGFDKLKDYGDLVAGIILDCVGDQIQISRRDPEWLVSIPRELIGNPAVIQPTGDPTVNNLGISASLDKIASSIGVSKETLILGGAALVVVLLLQRK